MMCLGALLVIAGLSLALAAGSTFAALGGVLILGGGIVLALAMESVVAEENLDPEPSTGPTDTKHGDVAA
jgi:hypothetical protein